MSKDKLKYDDVKLKNLNKDMQHLENEYLKFNRIEENQKWFNNSKYIKYFTEDEIAEKINNENFKIFVEDKVKEIRAKKIKRVKNG